MKTFKISFRLREKNNAAFNKWDYNYQFIKAESQDAAEKKFWEDVNDEIVEIEILKINGTPHGNTGNKNAKKKDADSHLNIRVNSHDKAGWVKQAQKEGMKLSEWVIKTLNGK